MTKLRQDKEREERITMEIIVDAYGPEEQAMGWYYYLYLDAKGSLKNNFTFSHLSFEPSSVAAQS